MVRFGQLINKDILDSEKGIGFLGDSEYTNSNGEYVMGYWSFDGIEHELLPELANTYEMELSEDELKGEQGYTIVNKHGTVCLITLYYKEE